MTELEKGLWVLGMGLESAVSWATVKVEKWAATSVGLLALE